MVDDAGVAIAAPDGGVRVSMSIFFPDGGAPSTFNYATWDACPNTGFNWYEPTIPTTYTMTTGSSFVNVAPVPRIAPPNAIRVRVAAPGLRSAEQPFFVEQQGSFNGNLAVLPFFAVTPAGQTSFRRFALVEYTSNSNAFAGFLDTPRSTHAIRIGADVIILNYQVINARSGRVVDNLVPPFTPIDGITRVFPGRVIVFGASTNQIGLQAFSIAPQGGVTPTALKLETNVPVQANTSGGEVAAAMLNRDISSPTRGGTLWVYFTSQGSQVPGVMGRVSFSSDSISDSWGGLQSFDLPLGPGAQTAHAGLPLTDGYAFIAVNHNYGLTLGPTHPMAVPTSLPLTPLGNSGPEQFAHVSRTATRIAGIARPVVPGLRQYDFFHYDVTIPDAGANVVRTIVPDLDTTTGTHAITDPNLARGCVVNDTNGVTFFFSTRLLATSTYQHWAQSMASNGALSSAVPLDIPDMADAVISCGGSTLHHIDMWQY